MIAGPNGSGKSVIKELIPKQLVGTYVNADEIERSLRHHRRFDFGSYELFLTDDQIRNAMSASSLVAQKSMRDAIAEVPITSGCIDLVSVEIDSYWASLIASIVREALLKSGRTFTFETVMSSNDKIDVLLNARSIGYRTYLYFVATEDPAINIKRVADRVRLGGHDVPEDKIRSRYDRSIGHLPAAIAASHRAFLFDNSGDEVKLVAEIVDGTTVTIHQSTIPNWLKPVLRR